MKALLIGAVVGLLLVLAYSDGAGAQPTTGCYWVDLEKITEETVAEMVRVLKEDYQFFAVAGDGSEAVYSSSCRSIILGQPTYGGGL